MTIKELMERSGIGETGRAISYVKDALAEMNVISETHVDITHINIKANQRYYNIPKNAIKILDIRAKNHNNNSNNYQVLIR